MTGGDQGELGAADRASGGLHALDLARPGTNAGHFAVLDDVDALRIGAAGVAPGDRVVTRRAAAPLQGGAEDRIARAARDVEERLEPLDLPGREELAVDAVQPVGVQPPLDLVQVVQVVREMQHAALAEHDVEVQLLGEPLPQLDRVIVDASALVPEVVGADDRRIAPGVAAAEPALFEHGHVAHAVLLGQVVGGRQTVPASADDDHLIARLRLRAAPDGSPVVVATPSVAGERPDRIALHGVSSQQSPGSLPFCQSPSGDASDDRRLR